MNRQHVTQAIEAELAAPPAQPDTRAADMAFAALSALSFVAASSLVPVAGAAIAAVGVVEAQRLRSRAPAPDRAQRVGDLVDEELAYCTLPGATPGWSRWVPWSELRDGEEVDVPQDLEHPAEVGFEPTRLAAYVGQAADWAHPLADGSRLHAHEYADGSVSLHRDRLDPGRGPATATLHWLTETPEGGAAGAALLAAGVGALIWAVST